MKGLSPLVAALALVDRASGRQALRTRPRRTGGRAGILFRAGGYLLGRAVGPCDDCGTAGRMRPHFACSRVDVADRDGSSR